MNPHSSPEPNRRSPQQPQPQPSRQSQVQPAPERRLPAWRFWVPVLIQSALIVAVPAQDAYTVVTGTAVTLQTAPVDPYDLLRGYYQTLSYEISRVDTLKQLPGGSEVLGNRDTSSFYVVLQAPGTSTTPPTPWKPVRISRDRPTDLVANQVSLRGDYQNGQILYGLETYYMPEDRRNQINADINQIQRRNQRAFVVDIKVDAQGNSVPTSLWVSDRNYRF